jgi:hypothetical protein
VRLIADPGHAGPSLSALLGRIAGPDMAARLVTFASARCPPATDH